MSIKSRASRSTLDVFKVSWKKDIRSNWTIYMCFLPALIYFITFSYIPMLGIVIAFKDFKITKGIFGSPWIGLGNFKELFTGDTFGLVIRNTIAMAILNLIAGFVFPIVLAILMSEVRHKFYKRTVQTVSYMPFFVAAVVISQLVREFVGMNGGVTAILTKMGFEQQNWLANPSPPVFWLINTFTEVWQGAGYGTIVFVAAISNVNGELFEAAAIDGAGRWKRITRITLPTIFPLIVIMLTLKIGMMFTAGFDKILLLYMPATYDVADVVSTYTYRLAFGSANSYGVSTASGLFQSIVSTTLLITSNYLNKKATKHSLF